MEFNFNTNRAEAERWLSTAVKLLSAHDLQGTKTFTIRARETDPRLEATEQIIAIADTLLAAESQINNQNQQPDWYAILQLAQYTQNHEIASSSSSVSGFGVLCMFLNGWRSRVAADPQFPFKVLIEKVVGVSSCVLGDMASRPNFSLNELDFVFSNLVFHFDT